MIVLFTEEAAHELTSAAEWYESASSGLGDDFRREIWNALNLCSEMPDLWAMLADGSQQMSVHRFPYRIVFLIEKEILNVIAIAHHKQFPDYWKDRI